MATTAFHQNSKVFALSINYVEKVQKNLAAAWTPRGILSRCYQGFMPFHFLRQCRDKISSFEKSGLLTSKNLMTPDGIRQKIFLSGGAVFFDGPSSLFFCDSWFSILVCLIFESHFLWNFFVGWVSVLVGTIFFDGCHLSWSIFVTDRFVESNLGWQRFVTLHFWQLSELLVVF